MRPVAGAFSTGRARETVAEVAAPPAFRVDYRVMSTTASEALVQLDSLRERLKEASGRLGWLRSYL